MTFKLKKNLTAIDGSNIQKKKITQKFLLIKSSYLEIIILDSQYHKNRLLNKK